MTHSLCTQSVRVLTAKNGVEFCALCQYVSLKGTQLQLFTLDFSNTSTFSGALIIDCEKDPISPIFRVPQRFFYKYSLDYPRARTISSGVGAFCTGSKGLHAETPGSM